MAKKPFKDVPDDEESRMFYIDWANEFQVVLVLTSDIERSRKARDSVFNRSYESREHGVAGLFASTGKKGYIFLGQNYDADVSAHEVYHLVDYIMHYLDVKERDGEVMAYHIGYLCGEIAKFYLHVKNKKAKKALTKKKAKRKINNSSRRLK